jgi:hypothetical protein
MDKQQLLKQIDKRWTGFQESYAGLSEAQLNTPGVVGDWSVKDILAHVTTWEEEALEHLPHILQGGRPPRYSIKYGGIDAFNALKTEQKRRLSLAEVLAQQEETHRRLLDYIQNAPDEALASDTRFRRRLRLDTYGHYPLHTRMIIEWRGDETQQGTLGLDI